ncbi:MAG TPA: CBS domain-containing protein [Roseiflexaceae bacterium]|nr:CBS domain-containing protein [Roseiflexaceae bacterium]
MQIILTHSYSDFDAVAAQFAAARIYPDAIPILSRQLNENVREYVALHAEELPFVRLIDAPSTVTHVILVDTAVIPVLAGFDPAQAAVTIIDHHGFNRDLEAHEQLIIEDVGATTTILVRRMIERGITVTPVEATLLLLGIYEDTGSLSLPGTREADVACAAWLFGQGARVEAIGEYLRRPLTVAQEQLMRQIDAQLHVEEIAGWNALFGWGEIDGAVPEISPLAQRLRDLYAPAILVLAVGIGGSGTQLVLRADAQALDIGALAAEFGGGGHPAAAAAFVRDTAPTIVLADVVQRIRTRVQPALLARDLMTTLVHTAPLDATVGEAEELLARYGHGALPVVDADRVVHGMIARRDLDRALRHGLHDAALTRYLWQGPPLIAPDTSISEVRRALTIEGQRIDHAGRLLVVDPQQRLLGIITRADLLRTLEHGRTSDIDGHADATDELKQFLDPPLLAIIREAAAVAEQRGTAIYIVGGVVRDMLLGRRRGDLDLVVEGDAIGLAAELARRRGGRVRGHAQFGTATLELTAPMVGVPLSLDFVMARTEFYERPSALPDVEAASLRHDLHRRDFTINTLAVCLNPSRYGRLYDFYGGRRDLQRGLVRVLHNLSFIDDPTRVLRAARLAARLGFTIEPRTRALINDAVEQEIFRRTTPQRIVHEICLLLAEPEPERALSLLIEQGVVASLLAGFQAPPDFAQRFSRARRAAFRDLPLPRLYLALLFVDHADPVIDALIVRYHPPLAESRMLRSIAVFHACRAEVMQAELAASRLDAMLHAVDPVVLRAAQLVYEQTAPQLVRRLVQYLDHLRQVRPAVDGRYIRSLGVAEGPQIGRLLAGLRAALLDGDVVEPEEQQRWIRRRIGEDAS